MRKQGHIFEDVFINCNQNKAGYMDVNDFEKIVRGLGYNLKDVLKSMTVFL